MLGHKSSIYETEIAEIGVNSSVQGKLALWDGGGGNTPAYIKLHSPNGTGHYLFTEDDGTIKVHNAAPLLFKKIERVEANMFPFFIALMIQALIERCLRNKIKDNKIDGLEVYPEDRKTPYPTTSKVLNLFEGISTYTITQGSKTVEEFKDELTDTQKTILNFLEISEEQYWKSNLRVKK